MIYERVQHIKDERAMDSESESLSNPMTVVRGL